MPSLPPPTPSLALTALLRSTAADLDRLRAMGETDLHRLASDVEALADAIRLALASGGALPRA